jgi:hypothetical protein
MVEKGRMANGEWVKGMGSALWFWLMAGLRPAIRVVLPVARRSRFILRSGMRGRVGDKACSDRARRAEARLFR